MNTKTGILEGKNVDQRDRIFPVKMSRKEIKILKERSNRMGMSAGAYLRFLLHREIQKETERGLK